MPCKIFTNKNLSLPELLYSKRSTEFDLVEVIAGKHF